MDLPTVWFVAVAVLWTGYLVLEGFDFGVGMLLRVLGRTEDDRRVALGAIGPVWDGNEVWLITAVGAMFAAFPVWYSAMFSGLYLPVLAVLLALIVRGVGLEYREKVDDPVWRARWDARHRRRVAGPGVRVGPGAGEPRARAAVRRRPGWWTPDSPTSSTATRCSAG